MPDLEHARMMLALAKRDHQAISHMLAPDEFDEAIFGFLAQQTVEKAMKAWLSLRNVPYPRTHDLQLLIRLLEEAREPDIHVFIPLVDLSDFAVQFRYEFFEDEPLDRDNTLQEVGALIEHVKQLIEEIEHKDDE